MDASLHVLVVDDHRETRERLARYLEHLELRVITAEKRRDARAAPSGWSMRVVADAESSFATGGDHDAAAGCGSAGIE